jgi:hypothetical protein
VDLLAAFRHPRWARSASRLDETPVGGNRGRARRSRSFGCWRRPSPSASTKADAVDETGELLVLRFEERDGIAQLARCTANGLDVELHHILTFT